MRIDEIVSLLEREYDEINAFEFMQDWIKWSNSDLRTYSTCTVYNFYVNQMYVSKYLFLFRVIMRIYL